MDKYFLVQFPENNPYPEYSDHWQVFADVQCTRGVNTTSRDIVSLEMLTLEHGQDVEYYDRLLPRLIFDGYLLPMNQSYNDLIYYTDNLKKIDINIGALASIKIRDNRGNETKWLALNKESIEALKSFFDKVLAVD